MKSCLVVVEEAGHWPKIISCDTTQTTNALRIALDSETSKSAGLRYGGLAVVDIDVEEGHIRIIPNPDYGWRYRTRGLSDTKTHLGELGAGILVGSIPEHFATYFSNFLIIDRVHVDPDRIIHLHIRSLANFDYAQKQS